MNRMFIAIAALAATVSTAPAAQVEITTTLDGQKYRFSTCRSADALIQRVGLHVFIVDGPLVVADSNAPDGWHEWANTQETLVMKDPLSSDPNIGELCR